MFMNNKKMRMIKSGLRAQYEDIRGHSCTNF